MLVKDPAPPGTALLGSAESPLPGAPQGFFMRPHHILMTSHSATKQLLMVQRRKQWREGGLDLSFPLTPPHTTGNFALATSPTAESIPPFILAPQKSAQAEVSKSCPQQHQEHSRLLP